MNQVEKMLRLQGSYRNTEIPYNLSEIHKVLEQRASITPIENEKVKLKSYKPVPREYNSFNVIRMTDDETANDYINLIKHYEVMGNLTQDYMMYNKSIDFIYSSMNNDTVPANWVVFVYRWLLNHITAK